MEKQNGKWKKDQTKVFDRICKRVCGYEPEDIAKLSCMVGFIEAVVTRDHQSSLVNQYNKQPLGCGVPTLDYGYFGKDGKMKGNTWIARIYFTARNGPRIGFPIECLKSGSEEKVDISNHAFSPRDKYIKAFFKCPDNYLDWNKLKAR